MTTQTKHFIEQRIESDLANKTYAGKVVTRFPPEPNGYLHVGHAKSICLNFTMAEQYNGVCHLRFDDTNPMKEEDEFVEAIKEDVSWLGFSWDSLEYTSEHFDKLYEYATEFIKQGKAYVCSLSADEIREHRGTLTEPGKPSPYRDRTVEENLKLFEDMRAGKYKDGEHVLRAKIDMAAGNINMRDPVMYRILHATHQHVGDKWCIYPMYDYAHCFSDAIENITHSLCTLEFQDHRPLYDWFLAQVLPKPLPQQIEFSRLNLSYTLTSKRKLKLLVENNIVDGWDDPRMTTICGMRRRGFTPNAIRNFCREIGISKNDSIIDMSLLEEFVRDDLNTNAPRAMCILKPIKVTIENLPEDHLEVLAAPCHPQIDTMGERKLNFTKTLYIEADDFMEEPPKKYKRLTIGKEIRLRNSYVIKCNDVVKDSNGKVIELKCSYDPDTLGKNPEDRKVKGVIHWVSATHNKKCKVRLFDRLFKVENPGSAQDLDEIKAEINENSLEVLEDCYIEQDLLNTAPESHYQFERNGYFVTDRYLSTTDELVFNRVVGLRDSWSS